MRERSGLYPTTLLTALAVLAVPSTLAAQAGEGATERSLRGFWRWALADVAGGEELRTGKGTVRIPAPPGGGEDAARGRRARRGPPGRARGRGHGRRRAGGPSFCRSGVGHPVHGRRWCVEKGFGLGTVPWVLVDPGDIVFGRGAPGRDRLGLDDLVEILGREALEVVLGRAGVGVRDDVTARWRRPGDGGARVLQLRAGTRPLAELDDVNGDGRVDAVLVFEGTR